MSLSGERKWPAQSPDLNSTMKTLRMIYSYLLVPDLTNAPLSGHNLPQTLQNLMESLLRKVVAVKATKWDQLHINLHGFRIGCPTNSGSMRVKVSANFLPSSVYFLLPPTPFVL